MKKKIFLFSIILLSFLSLIIGCNNASQISFEDESNSRVTDDGLSNLIVKIGKTPEYRTIFPEDWDETKKGNLFYKLTGNKSVPEDTSTTDDKLAPGADAGTVFTYQQISNNLGIITLDPIKWDLTLTAYQGTTPQDGPAKIDLTKPVLRATVKNIDLATGNQEVTFDLSTYVPNTEPPASEQESAATGDVDIDIRFHQNPTYVPKKVIIDIIDEGKTSALIAQNPGALPSKIPVEIKDFNNVSVTDINYKSVQLKTTSVPEGDIIGVKQGDYTLVVTFYGDTGETKDKIYLQYMESIKIDGGNLSKAVIDIPENAFNAPAAAPSNLTYSTYFEPVKDTKVVINESKRLYAQEVVDAIANQDILNNPDGRTEATNKLKEAISVFNKDSSLDKTNRYNLELKWKDNSFSEQGFKVNLKTTLTPVVGKENDIQIRWNPKNRANEIYYPTDTLYDVLDTDVNSQLRVVAGSLKPGSESVTISVPTGVFCSDISVTAYNTLGENTSEVIANAGTPIGMYTVAYKLADPNRKDVENQNHLASVKYNPEPGTTKVYFVMAYDYNSEAKLITSNTASFPYIENPLYHFEGWRYIDEFTTDPAKIVDMKNFEDTNSADGKLDADHGMRNKNVEVFASWTTPLSIKITFPSYAMYKDLKAGVQNPYNTIEPEYDAEGKKQSVTLTIPTVSNTEAQITEMKFKLYDPHADSKVLYVTEGEANDYKEKDGISETLADQLSGSTGGNSFVWDVTTFLSQTDVSRNGDVYRLNISYKYAKAKPASELPAQTEYFEPVTIDGNFFIKISK